MASDFLCVSKENLQEYSWLANSIKDAFIYLDMDNTDSLSYPESIQSMAGDFQKFQFHNIHDQ